MAVVGKTIKSGKVATAPAGRAASESKLWAERFFLLYFPFWSLSVAAVVIFKVYERWSALEYLLMGLGVALPCFLVPLLFPCAADAGTPLHTRFVFKANLWVVITSFIGNYFWTHYFYKLLHVSYSVPTVWQGVDWSLNKVPICMYLMTVPYFASYHIMAGKLLRACVRASSGLGRILQVLLPSLVVAAAAFLTAFLESFSIQSFPHYSYPDSDAMFKYGSAFYAIMFLVTYPMFWRIDELADRSVPWTMAEVAKDAFAACMVVSCLFDFWRLLLGPIPIAVGGDVAAQAAAAAAGVPDGLVWA